MELRNIHFKAAPEQTHEQEPCSEESLHTPGTFVGRIREVTTSPAEEYQRRSGHVEPISNALASVILAKSGTGTVTRKGLIANKKELGGKKTFWKADSPLCNQLTGEQSEYKVVYVFNPHNTDLIHLLDATTGAYLESLPAKDKVDPLDAQAAKKTMAEHKRVIGRASSHLQTLQGDETRKELDRTAFNAEAASHIIMNLPAAKDQTQPKQIARSQTPADQIDAVEQLADQGRHSIKQAHTRDRALQKAIDRRMDTMPKPAKRQEKPVFDPLDI